MGAFRRARRPGMPPQVPALAGGEPPTKVGGLREDILFESKEYPLALPKKDSWGDGVVTSSLSLAAAQRAPAHSFRCSSFSHRKRCAGLQREPCFPPGPSLKRPKEGPRPFLWKLSRSYGRFLRDGARALRCALYERRWNEGRKMEALVPAVIPNPPPCGRRGRRWPGRSQTGTGHLSP